MSIAISASTGGQSGLRERTRSAVVTERIAGLDALRGLAMILGIVLHSALGYVSLEADGLLWPVATTTTDPLCDYLTCWIHAFRLPVFFVLSGFFAEMLFQKRGPDAFWQHRYSRIFKPYLISLVTIGGLTLAAAVVGWLVSGRVTWQQLTDPTVPLPEAITRQGIGPGHLWFLQDLLILSIGYLLLRRNFTVPETSTTAESSTILAAWKLWLIPLWFAIPTSILIFHDVSIILGINDSFLPDPQRLLYYGIYFTCGVGFYRNREWFSQATSRPGPLLLTSLLLSVPLVDIVIEDIAHHGPLNDLLTALATALVAWYTIFGAFGFFMQSGAFASPKVRYLSDASYWIYLFHLPVVLLVQAALYPLAWPALLKMSVSCVVTFTVTLITYHAFVRHTWIGCLLHGPR